MKPIRVCMVVILSVCASSTSTHASDHVWEKLMLLTKNEQKPAMMRGLAFGLACTNADATGASEIIELTRESAVILRDSSKLVGYFANP